MKSYRNLIYAGILVILGLILLSSCVKTITGGIQISPNRTYYEPIAGAKLELSVVGSRQLVSGIDDSITFRLTNLGGDLQIPEWYAKDIDNLIVSYQPWLPGTEEPIASNWQTLTPVIVEPIVRFPLTIPTKSSVLIRAGLPFLENIQVTPGKERRFFIKAELNLRSINAQSKVFGISII